MGQVSRFKAAKAAARERQPVLVYRSQWCNRIQERARRQFALGEMTPGDQISGTAVLMMERSAYAALLLRAQLHNIACSVFAPPVDHTMH